MAVAKVKEMDNIGELNQLQMDAILLAGITLLGSIILWFTDSWEKSKKVTLSSRLKHIVITLMFLAIYAVLIRFG